MLVRSFRLIKDISGNMQNFLLVSFSDHLIKLQSIIINSMVSKDPIQFPDNYIMLGSATFVQSRDIRNVVNWRSEILALKK